MDLLDGMSYKEAGRNFQGSTREAAAARTGLERAPIWWDWLSFIQEESESVWQFIYSKLYRK